MFIKRIEPINLNTTAFVYMVTNNQLLILFHMFYLHYYEIKQNNVISLEPEFIKIDCTLEAVVFYFAR